MRIADLVATAMLLEAWCFFYVAYWMGSLYRSAHATWVQVVAAGNPDWLIGLFLVGAGGVYWRVARARPLLQVLAILGAMYGTYSYVEVREFVQSWSVTHGNVVAISALSSVGLVVIGMLAALDHYAGKFRKLAR